MTFDLQLILESKRALRCELAARPIAEKLRMLDSLRERALAVRGSAPAPGTEAAMLSESPLPYRALPVAIPDSGESGSLPDQR